MEERSRKRKQFVTEVGGGMDTTTKQHQETFSKLLVQRSEPKRDRWSCLQIKYKRP